MSGPEPPARTFSAIWYIFFGFMVILTLPLEYLGVDQWDQWMLIFAAHTFAWFLAPEIAAEDVKDGWDGTLTSFMFWRIPSRWQRVAIGEWFALVALWRYPHLIDVPIPFTDWEVGLLNGLLFLYLQWWLPWHYWEWGMDAPTDKLRHAIERLFGGRA